MSMQSVESTRSLLVSLRAARPGHRGIVGFVPSDEAIQARRVLLAHGRVQVSKIPAPVALEEAIKVLEAEIVEAEIAAAPEVVAGLVEEVVALNVVEVVVEAPAEIVTESERQPRRHRPSRGQRKALRRAKALEAKAVAVARPAPRPVAATAPVVPTPKVESAPAPAPVRKVEGPRGVVVLPDAPVETVTCNSCGMTIDARLACVPTRDRVEELIGHPVTADDAALLPEFCRCSRCADRSGRPSHPFLKVCETLQREADEAPARQVKPAPKAAPKSRSLGFLGDLLEPALRRARR